MRILFLGDIVGKPGLSACCDCVADLRDQMQIDAVIANAENSADGSGLTVRQFDKLLSAGVDALTMGDHIYKKKELIERLDDHRIVKPANFPSAAPGRTWSVVECSGGMKVAFISVLGRVYMRPVDCPFAALDLALSEIPADVTLRIVDVHAEATSDKQLIGRFLDGRATGVLGTHTHVPTADARVLPGGTAYISDVGMCGPYESIIGRNIDPVMETTLTFRPSYFHVASNDVRLCGAIIDADSESGKASSIQRFEHSVS